MTKEADDTVTDVGQTVKARSRAGAACLLVISGKSIGRMFKLSTSEMIVGRGEDADIQIDEAAISRRHAKLRITSEGVVLAEDLGSKNGTFFEGQRVDKIELHDGDRFQIGASTILKLTYQDRVEEEFQRQLYDSATRDGLTGVFNKKFLLDRLSAEFAYCTRHNVRLSLCMFDIDHFKRINDRWGHVAGDAVLRQLARVVNKASRTEDIICRYGGEEFAVLLREIDEKQAALYAERIRSQIEQENIAYTDKDGRPQSIGLTISIGVATLGTKKFGTVDDFVATADKRLYQAKRAGRNRVSCGTGE
jgi:two-component system cell cycle response regulator